MLLHTCIMCQNDLLKLSPTLKETIMLQFYKKWDQIGPKDKLNHHFDTRDTLLESDK